MFFDVGSFQEIDVKIKNGCEIKHGCKMDNSHSGEFSSSE